jgi:ABC-type nitrate/sulfonate/bicarbonate transport system permease component
MTKAGRPALRALFRVNFAGWLFIILLAAAAEGTVRLFHLDDSVSTPSATLGALVDGIGSGALLRALGTTLESFAEGLGIAIGAGVALGVVIGSSRTVRGASSVLIEFLRPIPVVAVIPLVIMYLGTGTPMERVVIAYAALWPILITTVYGVRGTDSILHEVARTSGVKRLGRVVRVAVPAALPSIATGIRIGASIALLVGVTAEYVTGTAGLGSYMRLQQSAFRLPEMYAAIVLTALLGYGINAAIRASERRVVFWAGEERLVRP